MQGRIEPRKVPMITNDDPVSYPFVPLKYIHIIYIYIYLRAKLGLILPSSLLYLSARLSTGLGLGVLIDSGLDDEKTSDANDVISLGPPNLLRRYTSVISRLTYRMYRGGGGVLSPI